MAEAITNTPLIAKYIEQSKIIKGNSFVFPDDESLQYYSHNKTETLSSPPEVVLKPRRVEEVNAIMKICNENKIPVTPGGAGTCLSGGALPQMIRKCD